MKPYICATLCLLVISGCAPIVQSPINTPAQNVTFDAGSKRAEGIERLDIVEIRSFIHEGLKKSEHTDAACEITGTQYRADFVTPAFVRLPVYQGRTDSVVLKCYKNADKTGKIVSQVISSQNLSAPTNEGITISTGTSGTRIGAVFNIRNRAEDRFNYPKSVSVNF